MSKLPKGIGYHALALNQKPAPPEVPAFKTIAVKAHRNRIAIAGGKFRCADCFAVIGEECPGCDAPAGYCEENCAMRDRSEVPAPDEPVCPSTSVHGPHKKCVTCSRPEWEHAGINLNPQHYETWPGRKAQATERTPDSDWPQSVEEAEHELEAAGVDIPVFLAKVRDRIARVERGEEELRLVCTVLPGGRLSPKNALVPLVGQDVEVIVRYVRAREGGR